MGLNATNKSDNQSIVVNSNKLTRRCSASTWSEGVEINTWRNNMDDIWAPFIELNQAGSFSISISNQGLGCCNHLSLTLHANHWFWGFTFS